MIKILYVSWFPIDENTGHAGGNTFKYYATNLSKIGKFRIDIVSIINKDYSPFETNFRINEHYVLDNFGLLNKYKNVGFYFNPLHKYGNMLRNVHADAIIKQLEKIRNEGYVPDIIILEWTAMLLLRNKISKIFKKSKIVASEHDVSYLGYKRRIYQSKGMYGRIFNTISYYNMKNRELSLLKKCDLIMPHNSKDMHLLVKDGIEESKIQVLTPYFMNLSSNVYFENSRNILFYGAMSRPENYLSAIWFIENVFNKLINVNKDLKFIIIGSNPHESINNYINSNIIVTGFVDNVLMYFSDALCVVAPLILGAGIKVKVLEAMNAGLPVLTNNVGIEGIPAIPSFDYIHCETNYDYETAILNLLSKEIDGNMISKNAKNFIEKNFSLDASLDHYITRIRKIVDEH